MAKMTHRDYFNELSALVSTALDNGLVTEANANTLTAFIESRIEAINKKNAGERKPTKTQVANTALSAKILEVMAPNTLYTISQILKLLDDETLNQSKISAVVRNMLIVTANGVENPNGTIERTMEKGVAYFRKLDLAESEE